MNKWTADEERLALAIDQLRRQRQAAASSFLPAALLARWRVQRQLRRLLGEVDRYKALVAGDEARPRDERPAARLSWLARRLGRERHIATVTFLVLPDRTLMVRAWRGRCEFGVLALTRTRLREAVADWHRSREEAAGTLLAGMLDLDGLLDGLADSVDALRIVPDDVLHGVPFALLRSGGKYLVERYALSIDCESAPPARRATKDVGTALLLAGVSRGSGEFGPLPHVSAELESVGAALGGREIAIAMDAAVTRGWLAEQLPRAWLAHLACHGVFRPDRPDESGLILAGADGSASTFTVRNLAALDLRALQHVTLSSCSAADSFIAPGRWIISLPDTALRAGAGSVLATSRPVRDDTAQALMVDFYRHLGRHGRARALQLAQLDRLRSPAAVHNHWDWGCFALYGDGGPLRVPAAVAAGRSGGPA